LVYSLAAEAAMPRATEPDAYEQRYMHVDEALARERVTMAWWGHAIFALALVLVGRAAFLEHRALDFAGLFAVPLLWLVFMTLLKGEMSRAHVPSAAITRSSGNRLTVASRRCGPGLVASRLFPFFGRRRLPEVVHPGRTADQVGDAGAECVVGRSKVGDCSLR
jgi:hypothetical protein